MKTYTFKIVYYLPPEQWNNGIKGVAFVEGYDRSHAISVFQRQYKGQFSTIDTCEKMGQTLMKNYEFMAEKYPLFNNDPKEADFPIPEGYECFRVCRYGDGYVYRVLKELTDNDEFPCRGYLYLFSVTRQELYVTDIYDQIKIHMTDFEHGCPYATSFELLKDDNWTRVDCDGEVWCDYDMEKPPMKLYRKV